MLKNRNERTLMMKKELLWLEISLNIFDDMSIYKCTLFLRAFDNGF